MRNCFVCRFSWSRALFLAVAGSTVAAVTISTAPVRQALIRPEFAAASIKRMPPGPALAGQMFVCHGIDGYRRALFGHFDPDVAAQGRCAGSGVHLVDLIGLAYGISPQFVSGGPDWVYFNTSRSSGSNIAFQIE